MKDYIVGISGLGLSLYIYLGSKVFERKGVGLADNPAYYPRILALLLALLSFAVLVGALKRKEKVKFKFNRQVVFNIGRFLAIFLAYILLTQPLGFIIATALFSIAAILVLGGNKRQSFIYSVPISLVTYFLFSYVLKVPLPKGILPFI